jgi:hypothetical protein
MSSRSKMMGAGLASSHSYNVNTNLNTSGGARKQGIPPYTGLDNWANRAVKINANGSPEKRRIVFCMNQLGGVGVGRSQFRTASSAAKPDGVHCRTQSATSVPVPDDPCDGLTGLPLGACCIANPNSLSCP